jgi:hypothetical protein
LLVYFGIPLCYPPYTDRTATCAPPPCRHVDGGMWMQRLRSLLWLPWTLTGPKLSDIFSLFFWPTLGIWTFFCHL